MRGARAVDAAARPYRGLVPLLLDELLKSLVLPLRPLLGAPVLQAGGAARLPRLGRLRTTSQAEPGPPPLRAQELRLNPPPLKALLTAPAEEVVERAAAPLAEAGVRALRLETLRASLPPAQATPAGLPVGRAQPTTPVAEPGSAPPLHQLLAVRQALLIAVVADDPVVGGGLTAADADPPRLSEALQQLVARLVTVDAELAGLPPASGRADLAVSAGHFLIG